MTTVTEDRAALTVALELQAADSHIQAGFQRLIDAGVETELRWDGITERMQEAVDALEAAARILEELRSTLPREVSAP